ncbi:hypothetical protein [Kineosporia sp. NBRC 101731]|uniref:hypothetical protein n=1 Tax=Kineosporia sp. NBRC 101731 TaxID=3032199 RepID=UPI0025551F99|nr:hypothetical protein [Kineosporia sp. NBRC 101731]
MDEETPKFWAVPLGDIELREALDAAGSLIRQQPYIGVHDICAEVERMRQERAADNLPAPNVDPDDVVAYLAEQRALAAADVNGRLDREAYEAGGFTLTGAAPWVAAGELRQHRQVDVSRIGALPGGAR